MTAAKNATKCENTSLNFTNNFTLALYPCSPLYPNAHVHRRLRMNYSYLDLKQTNLQVNFFARVSTNGSSIHTTTWFALCDVEAHVQIKLCLLQISTYIVLS